MLAVLLPVGLLTLLTPLLLFFGIRRTVAPKYLAIALLALGVLAALLNALLLRL